MIDVRDKSKCCGCEACLNICPKSCITMAKDEDGFCYPSICVQQCIQCGKCERVCPIIHAPNLNRELNLFYACRSLDYRNRLLSSSGGIFHLLATEIISRGGYVFGTRFDDDFRSASVDYTINLNELNRYMGSKYIQSHVRYNYKIVNEQLRKGKEVLFCGTPCQIAGLHNCLGDIFPNLYTIDLVCHGVPSEKVWNRYLDCLSEADGKQICMASLRAKRPGWKRFSIEIKYSNGDEVLDDFRTSSFGKAFNNRIVFRPSCEHCKFKGTYRVSDLTLGDFWGIGETMPEMDDDKGTSLIIVHTKKGLQLMKQISSKTTMYQVDEEAATRRNPYLKYSVIPHRNKRVFFGNLEEMQFDELVSKFVTKELVPMEYLRRIKNYIQRKIH